MREQLKQQLRDMLVTLGRAEAVLDSKSKKKEEDAVKQLLEDMQASAIAIGNTIEEEEGLETQTVDCLEEYCELLWQYLTAAELKERFRLGRELAGKRGNAAASLEQEFEGRQEVVFLLYRRDRWKNMEGIWSKAMDNPLYDCRVLVSPYTEYGEEEEGIIREELGMFPADTGAMDYHDYPIEEMRPDLVFVDGPYDEDGKTGAVPDYEFETVRKSALAVVYLPFYEDKSQVKEADCRLLQVTESDLVIVGDEELREAYAETLRRMEDGSVMIRKICVRGAVDVERVLEKNGKRPI